MKHFQMVVTCFDGLQIPLSKVRLSDIQKTFSGNMSCIVKARAAGR